MAGDSVEGVVEFQAFVHGFDGARQDVDLWPSGLARGG
jgi:hypothetical protein